MFVHACCVRSIMTVVQLFRKRDEEHKGRHLFKGDFEDALRLVLVHVHNGCLTDPPGVALYEVVPGKAQLGLPVMRCLRGTSAVESVFSESNLIVMGNNNSVPLVVIHGYFGNIKMHARRHGLKDPPHRHLWQACMNDTHRICRELDCRTCA
jgi:hypothetical protein